MSICALHDKPMSYNSTGTSLSHNNGMEGEAKGSRSTECVCNLPINFFIKKKKGALHDSI